MKKQNNEAEIFGLKMANKDFKEGIKRKVRQVQHLEGIIKRQKHSVSQLDAILKETRFLLKSKKQEAYFDMCELINNLNDDLQMDKKNGEYGYKDEKEVVKAIKKYTLKLLKIKLKKWDKFSK